MSRISSRSTSSPCRRSAFGCCSCLSCWLIIAAASFTFNVTEHPTAGWTEQQMVEAFPEDTAPRYLLRDRDKIWCEFQQRIRSMSIEEALSAPPVPGNGPTWKG